MKKTDLVRRNDYVVSQPASLISFLLDSALFLHTKEDVQTLLSQDRIEYKNQIVHEDISLQPQDVVTLLTPQSLEPNVSEDISLLYEDEYFFAVSKPAQLPVHPSGKYYFNTLSSLIERKLGLSGLYPYNRLDRETSGIVLFAKQKEFISKLQSIHIDKFYYALVFGRLKDSKGTISAPLKQKTVGELRHHVVVDSNGKLCTTEYEVLDKNEKYSLIKINLITGRKHQIRVHFAHLGHPLVGDKQYGDHPKLLIDYSSPKRVLNNSEVLEKVGASRQLLHCYKVRLRHPITDKLIVIEDLTRNYFFEFVNKANLSFYHN